jgi:hypothetical protein
VTLPDFRKQNKLFKYFDKQAFQQCSYYVYVKYEVSFSSRIKENLSVKMNFSADANVSSYDAFVSKHVCIGKRIDRL